MLATAKLGSIMQLRSLVSNYGVWVSLSTRPVASSALSLPADSPPNDTHTSYALLTQSLPPRSRVPFAVAVQRHPELPWSLSTNAIRPNPLYQRRRASSLKPARSPAKLTGRVYKGMTSMCQNMHEAAWMLVGTGVGWCSGQRYWSCDEC